MTKECYQIGFLESLLRNVFLKVRGPIITYIGTWYLVTFLVFLTMAMQLRNSPGADVQDQTNSKFHQKCQCLGFFKFLGTAVAI